jgi:hypothetical protein
VSTQRIHKYEVPYGEWTVALPECAEILHVATQPTATGKEAVFLWALVRDGVPTKLRQIGYFGTGEEIPVGAEYIGTAITPCGTFVWHVFDGPGGLA